ncbi:MAG: recombinase family protein [Oscillospiraceae bacterium]|nr:recombinase family protein [Oscillospiraceae bacterium]
MNVRIIPAKSQMENGRNQYHHLRVAAYCRVSTDYLEQLNSYQVQIEYYTDYINSNKEWTLAGIFADEGLSGTSTRKRKEFNRMIRLCRQKKIDLVLCKSASRFARNTVDCLEYIRELKSLGIGVIFEIEGINTLTEYSEFLLALHSSFAQAESESISRNVSLGIQMSFKEGKVRYNYRAWLGYRKGEDGKPEIIPEEAKIVKLIFRLYLDGMSMKSITSYLIENKIPNKQGNLGWRDDIILRILKNEKYSGDALLQKTYTADCISHKMIKNHGERPMYYVSDCHPAIIDRDTFNLVQQEMKRRVAKRRISDKCITEQGKYSGKYALTELMICGECGTPYRRVTWNVHGKKAIVWRCISRLDHGSRYCKNSPTIHEEPLHRGIIQAINEYHGCAEEIAGILKSGTKAVLNGQMNNEISAIEKRLSEIDEARQSMINLIVSGAVESDSLDEEFRKLHDEEENLNQVLSELKSKNTANEAIQKQIDTAFSEIASENFILTEFDEVTVRHVLECVRVIDKTHIQVIFKGGYEAEIEIDKW